MDKIIKHNDRYCHIDNTSIIFDDEEYNKFNEICQIFNVETITIGSYRGDKIIEFNDGNSLLFKITPPKESLIRYYPVRTIIEINSIIIRYFYRQKLLSFCINQTNYINCHFYEQIIGLICKQYPQLAIMINTLHLIQMYENSYSHKHDLQKFIKISPIEYENLHALCNVYEFYACHYIDQSIIFIYKKLSFNTLENVITNLRFKITAKHFIISYFQEDKEINIRKSRKPKHNGFLEIFKYLDENFSCIKIIPFNKLAILD